MFPLTSVSLSISPLAQTADEIKPWMIIAIAIGALLALLLLIVAARKSRGPKGEDLREAMSDAKRRAAASRAQDMQSSTATGNTGVAGAVGTAGGAKRGRGKHAK